LSEEAVAEIVHRKTWLEWKILKQYYELFLDSLSKLKEICYHVAVNTRYIGEAAAGER
jgi:hypothetical protein